MSQTILLRQTLVQKIESVLHAMHDSRLLPGLLVSVVLIALMAGHPASFSDLISLHPVMASSVVEPAGSASNADDDVPVKPLSREMRKALDFASRKYHVSATALEPAFIAAQESGREARLDPMLIVAVIAIESRFNPYAESVVGAQGLMQVMPQWHQDKIPQGMGDDALFDPETNVRVGTRILGESVRRAGGLMVGLQQFGGASDDPEMGYANKVLAEKQQFEAAAGRAQRSATAVD